MDDSGIPTFDEVRAKIEGRSAKAAGQTELDAATAEGRQQTQTAEVRAQAAQVALDKIRSGLHDQ